MGTTEAEIRERAIVAAHVAICEYSLDDCLEYRGQCLKAVEAALPDLLADNARLREDLAAVREMHVATTYFRDSEGSWPTRESADKPDEAVEDEYCAVCTRYESSEPAQWPCTAARLLGVS